MVVSLALSHYRLVQGLESMTEADLATSYSRGTLIQNCLLKSDIAKDFLEKY